MYAYDKKVSKVMSEIDNAIAADRYPKLMRALGNLPPTRAEIEKIRLFGYPDWILPPPSQERWSMTKRINRSERWKRTDPEGEDDEE